MGNWFLRRRTFEEGVLADNPSESLAQYYLTWGGQNTQRRDSDLKGG
jgi:hypothetical protein